MTIEASQFINTLNTSFPRSTDLLKEGDDHIRLIKANLKNTFPNIITSVNMTSDTLNYLNSNLASTPTGIKFTNSISIANGASVDFSSTEIKVGNANGDPSTYNQLAAINVATLSVLFKSMFPVGFVYCTGESNTNPGTLPLFKGTSWVPYGAGRYMLSAGNQGDNGPWGFGLVSSGTASFGIGYTNMPQHTHVIPEHGHSAATQGGGTHGHTVPLSRGGDGGNGNDDNTPYAVIGIASTSTAGGGEHNHPIAVSNQVAFTTGGVDQGSGTTPIAYTPAFTSAYYWKRTS